MKANSRITPSQITSSDDHQHDAEDEAGEREGGERLTCGSAGRGARRSGRAGPEHEAVEEPQRRAEDQHAERDDDDRRLQRGVGRRGLVERERRAAAGTGPARAPSRRRSRRRPAPRSRGRGRSARSRRAPASPRPPARTRSTIASPPPEVRPSNSARASERRTSSPPIATAPLAAPDEQRARPERAREVGLLRAHGVAGEVDRGQVGAGQHRDHADQRRGRVQPRVDRVAGGVADPDAAGGDPAQHGAEEERDQHRRRREQRAEHARLVDRRRLAAQRRTRCRGR